MLKARAIASIAVFWTAALSCGGILAAQVSEPGPAEELHPFPSELLSGSFTWKATGVSENLRQALSAGEGGTLIRLRWAERDPSDADYWHITEVEENTTFRISATATRRGGNEVFISGLAGDGDVVLEKWIYAPRRGGYSIEPDPDSAVPQPIGVSMPQFASSEQLNGTEFVPPIAKQRPGARIRVELYRGSGIELPRCLVADPEGRYVLALTYPSGKLYRFALVGSSQAPELLYSPSNVPHLAVANTLQLLRHESSGRSCVLTEGASGFCPVGAKNSLLLDSDNDGEFDGSPLTITTVAWKQAGLADDGVFEPYWNTGESFDW
jgi:hypothetical protein